MRIAILLIAAALTPSALLARPSYVSGALTCMTCHAGGVITGPATVSFLKVNGAAPSGSPPSVTITPGSSFSFEYRVQGFPFGGGNPLIGGYLRPNNGSVDNTADWVFSTGPTWNDNSKSGATPWLALGSAVCGTNYGSDGTTFDDGSVSDLNGLGSDEVFSATMQAVAGIVPGTYTIYCGASDENDAGTAERNEAPLIVYVVTPTPTPSASFTASPTPSASPTEVPPGSTATATPSISPTPSVSPTFSATPSRSETPLPSATATLNLQSGAPGFLRLAVVPQPNAGSGRLYLELGGGAESLELRVFSSAMTLSASLPLGAFPGGKGWMSFQLPPELASGFYLAEGVAKRGNLVVRSRPFPLVVIR